MASAPDLAKASWEKYATLLANAATDEELANAVQKIVDDNKVNLETPARVVYAKDTRESGPALVAALEDGLAALGAEVEDKGLLTTPQLHFIVRCLNTNGMYGEPTEEGYYKKLSEAFKSLMANKKAKGLLTIDCANGIGAPKLKELAKYIPEDILEIKIINDDVATHSKLNYQVGLKGIAAKPL